MSGSNFYRFVDLFWNFLHVHVIGNDEILATCYLTLTGGERIKLKMFTLINNAYYVKHK